MKSEAIFLRQIAEIESLPDGVYPGLWGGYFVHFSVAGINYEAQTKDGIRMQRADCEVTVNKGSLSVELSTLNPAKAGNCSLLAPSFFKDLFS